MNPLARLSCTLIAGRSGSGKSTWARRYLRRARGVALRLIWDDQGEHCRAFGGVRPANSVEDLERDLAQGWVFFDPALLFPGRPAEAFGFFCDWALEVSKRGAGRKLVLVDEVWRYCHPGFIPSELAAVVQTGRKWELETVFATQRPQRVNESILGEVTEAVGFHLIGSNAVEKMADNYELDPAELGQLPTGHWVSRNMQSGAVLRGRLW